MKGSQFSAQFHIRGIEVRTWFPSSSSIGLCRRLSRALSYNAVEHLPRYVCSVLGKTFLKSGAVSIRYFYPQRGLGGFLYLKINTNDVFIGMK